MLKNKHMSLIHKDPKHPTDDLQKRLDAMFPLHVIRYYYMDAYEPMFPRVKKKVVYMWVFTKEWFQ